MRLTAEGMRKSELFWPHHSVSIAAKQPGKRWSAPLKLSEVTGQRDRHRERHRERPRGWSLARGHPCEEQMEEGDREKDREGEERLRKVSQTCGEAAGWTRELGGAWRPTGEAERRRGTHRGGRNMVASEEASNGGGLVHSAPHSGWGWGHGGNHLDPKEQR